MPQPPDPVSTTTSALSSGSLADVGSGLAQVTDAQRQLNTELTLTSQLGQSLGKTLTTAFVDIATQGKSLGDMLNSLALNLSKMTLSAAFQPLQGAISSGFQALSLAPPALTSDGSLAAPSDFPLSAGDGLPTLGPSLDSSAASASSAAGSSASAAAASPNVVLNVSTPDAESFRRSETQLSALLSRAVGQGQRNL